MAKSLWAVNGFKQSSYLTSALPQVYCRALHSTHRQQEAITATTPTQHQAVTSPLPLPQQPSKPPLSLLPFKTLFRSYLINSLSSTPVLLAPSLRIMTVLAHSQSPILSPDRNPILRFLLKKTFYANYCAGETRSEIQRTVGALKDIGFRGVILTYAKEIVLQKGHDLSKCEDVDDADIKADVQAWKEGNLKTIDLTQSGEFVGMK